MAYRSGALREASDTGGEGWTLTILSHQERSTCDTRRCCMLAAEGQVQGECKMALRKTVRWLLVAVVVAMVAGLAGPAGATELACWVEGRICQIPAERARTGVGIAHGR